MHALASASHSEPIVERARPGMAPSLEPREGTAGELGAVALRLAQERDRIAAGVSDVVVRRMFAAGLGLESALALMGDHRASGKVRQAISDLDQAVSDLRDILFDHRRPDPPAARSA